MHERYDDHYREAPINERGRAYDPDASHDERTYALYMHLSLLAYFVLAILAIIIPIVMWQIKKEDSPFLDDHGRETVNFHISLVLWSIIFTAISIPLGFVTCGIGFGLAFVPYIIGLIGMVQASQAANRGEFYRYPMTFRFI